MKRLTAFWLLISLLLAQTDLNQLLKIPLLFQHYQEHSQQNAGFSVKDFLVVHYLQKQVKDQDYDRDMQLPFKSQSAQLLVLSSALIPARPALDIHLLSLCIPSPARYSEELLSRTTSAIWQPPQSTC